MPEKQVYLCDKTEGIPISPKTKVCGRDTGDDPVEVMFSYSVNGAGEGPSAVESHLFCSTAHANFWLKRQRIADPRDLKNMIDSEDAGD